MNVQFQKLAERRQRLIAQAASQRMLFANNAHALRKPLAIADKGLSVMRYVKHHPILVAGGSATLLALTRPFDVAKW